MKKLKSSLTSLIPKSSFARGVSILVGGTVSAQALTILASPILTRLYTPEHFGLLAVYASILSLFTVIASLRYEQAIPLPKEDSEAIQLVILSLGILIAVTILSVLLVLFGRSTLAVLIKKPEMATYFWMLPIGVFIIGFYQIFYYWSVRTKSFGDISKTKISQSVATISIQLAASKFGAIALMIGQTSGQAVGSFTLARPALRKYSFKNSSLKDILLTAKRFKSFPLYSTWGSLLNTASLQLPPILFAIFFSASTAGLYALANRVLALPMGIIGGAIGNVFLSNAAESYRNNTLSSLFESVYQKLTYIIMPIMLVLVIDGPRLFEFFFGPSWYQAGELARWMAPWLAIVFIGSPLSILFIVLEKQKQAMYFQALLLFVRLIAVVIGYLKDSFILAIILFSFISVICWIFFLMWATIKCKSNYYMLLMPFLKALISSLGCTCILFLNSLLNTSQLYWYISLVITLSLILTYYLKIFKKSIKS